jgi:hypothetical protein
MAPPPHRRGRASAPTTLVWQDVDHKPVVAYRKFSGAYICNPKFIIGFLAYYLLCHRIAHLQAGIGTEVSKEFAAFFSLKNGGFRDVMKRGLLKRVLETRENSLHISALLPLLHKNPYRLDFLPCEA